MENKSYFDPYNFNNQVAPSQIQLPDELSLPQQNVITGMTPIMFYEQQFWYYNYLTKMLEYKIKLKEYENLNAKKC